MFKDCHGEDSVLSLRAQFWEEKYEFYLLFVH